MKLLHSLASFLAVLLLLVNALTVLPINISHASSTSMTFTTGKTISFSSNTEMSFWSGVSMKFGTGIHVQFIEIINGNGVLEPCDVIQVIFPPGFIMEYCSWWEILFPDGTPTGFEFHIDQQYGPAEFHVDMVFPGPFPLPVPGGVNLAEKKVSRIAPCEYFTVHWPVGWYPAPCSWWEIIDPETGHATGFEFHVDWTNESCEFHVDEVIPGPYILPFPAYEIVGRRKIDKIEVCDWLAMIDPIPADVAPCTWWEIMYQGQPTGLEFHIDEVVGDTFHVDQIIPDPLLPPVTYPTVARKKITTLEPCLWLRVDDPLTVPAPCTWWKIISPDIGDVEFHVDTSYPDGTFHVDEVIPTTVIDPTFQMRAEKKITEIGPCNWFKVRLPVGFLPDPCTYWRITYPAEWAGVTFHVDANDGISLFHIDNADPLPPRPTPPPWNVTAELFDPWYYKPAQIDYAPSGVPDFDQRQWGTYNWTNGGAWSHCGPVAVANSLWWLDSEFEPNPVLPPVINDGFPLVVAYGPWDDHSPNNVPWLVEHLAFLMDTDGRRTGLAHSGTNVVDMESGLAHYLSWTGINPQGDVNGDGEVNQTDVDLVNLAMGSMPGAPNWNMAADVFPASIAYPPIADNIVDANDLGLVMANVGQKGRFYEHTVMKPDFYFIEEEVERCQDVVLLVGYWVWTGSTWYREPGGHYVTVAGVDSQHLKLALSDPVVDAFETGLIGEGRIPIPHGHMPPEPPYIMHNDAAFVSQDIYDVVPVTPPWPPCPGGNWFMPNFASWRPAPPYFAVIEAAVVTSPLGVHDINVTSVKTCKDGCTPLPVVGKGYTAHINITVLNEGDFTETFTLDTYAGGILINSTVISNLAPKTATTFAFVWNTAPIPYGTYTISSYAHPVSGETDLSDNNCTGTSIRVVVPGNVDSNGIVNMLDLYRVALVFGKTIGMPGYDPNADIDDNHMINMLDLYITALNFGKIDPPP
ncbi:MAG: hypothetical protein QXJ02_02150 [Candidatus Bathyarchaeia archaeon]